jgi:aryl-alcohol dehydrogenase
MDITAAVLRVSDGAYALEAVNLDEPGPGEILVRILAASMCHTDVLPRAEGGLAPLPIVTGHEGAGIVERVGDGVTRPAVGDHVVLSFDSCGECRNCRNALPCYCETFLIRNLSGRRVDGSTAITDHDGEKVSSRWFGQSSFATHAIATARNAVVVDDALPLELMAPLGCGLLTGAGSILVALDVQPGTSLVVTGAGAVGLAAIMAAQAAGATTIVAVDLHDHRLELAAELGATHVLRGDVDGLADAIIAATAGGADYGFDTTGVPSVMTAVLRGVRMAGHVGFVGVQLGELVLDGLALVGKTVTGILEGSADPQITIPRLIGLWQEGRFPIERLVETFPLSAINEAEQASLTGRVIKPVLRVGD